MKNIRRVGYASSAIVASALIDVAAKSPQLAKPWEVPKTKNDEMTSRMRLLIDDSLWVGASVMGVALSSAHEPYRFPSRTRFERICLTTNFRI